MTPAESAVRALAKARYPYMDVWHFVSTSGRHYVLGGPTRNAHVTLGGGASGCDTAEGAWEAAAASMRLEVETRLAEDRRQRDLIDAEIDRLSTALWMHP